MRHFLVVLAAGVTAGLLVFFAFSRSMTAVGNNLLMDLSLFVWFVAVLAFAAGATALVLRGLLLRTEERGLRELRARIARLEAAPQQATTPGPAAPAVPAAGPAVPPAAAPR